MAKQSIFQAFGTDKNLEQNGVIMDLGDLGRYLIARAGGSNIEFNKFALKHRAEIKAIGRGDRSGGNVRAFIRKSLVEVLLKDWEKVPGENGKEIAYSKESANTVLTRLPDLADTMFDFASDGGNFSPVDEDAIADAEETLGNG